MPYAATCMICACAAAAVAAAAAAVCAEVLMSHTRAMVSNAKAELKQSNFQM
jgi:hypothetical protein